MNQAFKRIYFTMHFLQCHIDFNFLGTLIFNLRERLQLPIGRFPDVKFQVVEQFLNRGGNPRPAGSQWIVVDFDSGDVTQGERIDRESLCGLSSDCYISVKVRIVLFIQVPVIVAV